MGQSYTIQQGDHISRIAEQFGFLDYNHIWNDPANAPLAKLRANAHVLLPGDILFIPDKKEKWEPCATTKLHRFQVKLQPLHLRLVLKDFDEEPMANLNCLLDVEGTLHTLKSDASGLIEAEVPRTAQQGFLRIPDLDLEFPVSIGELDPHEERSGALMRLINLGYLDGDVDESDESLVQSAIEEFQCDQKMKVTGDLDGATRQKLKQAHGT